MTKIFSAIVLIVALTILGIVGFTSYNYVKEKNSLKFTPIQIDFATTTVSSSISIATSTEDTTNWKTYKNPELGYSVKYPDDLILNYDESILIIAFPKKNYFSWPLQDDVKLTVVATSSCLTDLSLSTTSDIQINDRLYKIEKDSIDAGMGSRWHETVYSITGNNICYKITMNLKGTNGAGFYVDDKALIAKYDNQHSIDISKVSSIIWAILGTFEMNTISGGDIES